MSSGRRREDEIEVAVVVQIHEQGLGCRPRIGQAGGSCHGAKLPPALIPEQDSPPGGRDVQVEPSVVVEIAERRRDGPIPER